MNRGRKNRNRLARLRRRRLLAGGVYMFRSMCEFLRRHTADGNPIVLFDGGAS